MINKPRVHIIHLNLAQKSIPNCGRQYRLPRSGLVGSQDICRESLFAGDNTRYHNWISWADRSVGRYLVTDCGRQHAITTRSREQLRCLKNHYLWATIHAIMIESRG